jgi:hypothetical protein
MAGVNSAKAVAGSGTGLNARPHGVFKLFVVVLNVETVPELPLIAIFDTEFPFEFATYKLPEESNVNPSGPLSAVPDRLNV